MCITVFICSTRIVLLILFYHLMIFEQPRYGDIGSVRFGIDVHSNFLMPYRKHKTAGIFLQQNLILHRKIPAGLFFIFIAAYKV